MRIIAGIAFLIGTLLWLDEGIGHRFIMPGVIAPNLVELCMISIVFVLSRHKTIIYVHPDHKGCAKQEHVKGWVN